jgi:hypothetical protein
MCKLAVSSIFNVARCSHKASDNAKEAEDNARKAKGAVKTVLGTIAALLEQLGKCRLH